MSKSDFERMCSKFSEAWEISESMSREVVEMMSDIIDATEGNQSCRPNFYQCASKEVKVEWDRFRDYVDMMGGAVGYSSLLSADASLWAESSLIQRGMGPFLGTQAVMYEVADGYIVGLDTGEGLARANAVSDHSGAITCLRRLAQEIGAGILCRQCGGKIPDGHDRRGLICDQCRSQNSEKLRKSYVEGQ